MMASMYSHEPLRLERDQENKSNSTESGSVSRKRKASIDLEAPEKRHRHSCKTTDTSEPSYVFEEVNTKGSKRKASSEREIPKKRYRASTSSSTSSISPSSSTRCSSSTGSSSSTSSQSSSTGSSSPSSSRSTSPISTRSSPSSSTSTSSPSSSTGSSSSSSSPSSSTSSSTSPTSTRSSPSSSTSTSSPSSSPSSSTGSSSSSSSPNSSTSTRSSASSPSSSTGSSSSRSTSTSSPSSSPSSSTGSSRSTSPSSTRSCCYCCRGGKRKASTEREIPKKRYRASTSGSTSSSSPSGSTSGSKRKEVSAEDVQELLTRKRKTSTCEESPRKRQKSSDLNQSSCSSSSSQGKNGSILPEVNTSRADFEEKYMQFHQIREDVCGPVYAGFRLTDYLPVAIKYVQGPHVVYDMNGYQIPVEVALVHKVAGGPESVGKFATVSFLDWYYLDQDLILVTERPVPSVVLTEYLDSQGGVIKEQEAKTFLNQLVDATFEMQRKGVFHRDIKADNILLEIGSRVPRVRLVNFGCGSLIQERPHYTFSGSLACAPPEWYVRGEYNAGPTTVWQLGALLYRLLHGFKNSTMGILCGKMQLSRDSATQLSKDCLDFLQLCLKKNPEERATLQQLQFHPWLK